jgi:ABC-type phosphate transport system permease subunit
MLLTMISLLYFYTTTSEECAVCPVWMFYSLLKSGFSGAFSGTFWIIIIIIIIVFVISFVQGIHNYVLETNLVSKVHTLATVLY